MTVYNAFLGTLNYKGIGHTCNVTVPNDSVNPLTDSDVGKPVTWGTDGYKLVGDGEKILGFLEAVDSGDSAYVTVALKGVFEATMAADAVAVGDFVIGAANGNVAKSYDDVNLVDIPTKCVAVMKKDSTTIVVECL